MVLEEGNDFSSFGTQIAQSLRPLICLECFGDFEVLNVVYT